MPAGLDTSVKSNDGLLSQSKPVRIRVLFTATEGKQSPNWPACCFFTDFFPHFSPLFLSGAWSSWAESDILLFRLHCAALFFEPFFIILPNQIYLPCVPFLHVLNRIQISQKTQNLLYLFFHLIYWPSLGWEDTLEEEIATHSNILAWRIPMDWRAWWAVVHSVAKSRTWLKRLSIAQHIVGLGTVLHTWKIR